MENLKKHDDIPTTLPYSHHRNPPDFAKSRVLAFPALYSRFNKRSMLKHSCKFSISIDYRNYKQRTLFSISVAGHRDIPGSHQASFAFKGMGVGNTVGLSCTADRTIYWIDRCLFYRIVAPIINDVVLDNAKRYNVGNKFTRFMGVWFNIYPTRYVS